jgi:hypothetical protein
MKMTKLLCVALGLLVSTPALGNIMLTWDPPECAVPVGGFVDLSIYANIPEADAVISWGLDLYFNEAVVAVSNVAYGPLWYEFYAPTPDPDDPLNVDLNFAATCLYPPAGVWGASVLLATITFAVDPGLVECTHLVLGAHQPPDQNEGFLRNPPPTCFFVPFEATEGCIIPEPASLALLGLGLLLVRRR